MLLSDVCLTSVTYIWPKLRTERPRKTQIGAEVAHVTCDLDTMERLLPRYPSEIACIGRAACSIKRDAKFLGF